MFHSFRFRIVVCLLALLLLQEGCLREQLQSDDAGACPAAQFRWLTTPNRSERKLSHYDFLLKKYAAGIGMDWRLLAAIVYHESKFNERALSPVGAKGLMQLMDVAAVHMGEPEADLYDPETSIRLGTVLLEDLVEKFRQEGVSDEDVIRFAIASYNVGGGSLSSRRARADSLGLDRNSWSDVATIFLSDSSTTPAYISAVESTYAKYCTRFR